jgi:hypothetical protein
MQLKGFGVTNTRLWQVTNYENFDNFSVSTEEAEAECWTKSIRVFRNQILLEDDSLLGDSAV